MAFQQLIAFAQQNKIDCFIFLARLYTMVSCVLFVVPFYGIDSQPVFYQRALLSNALSCALRLHQRMPVVALNLEFLSRVLLEDSAHYIIYSLIFIASSSPVTLVVIPLFLLALFNISFFIQRNIGNAIGVALLNSLVSKVTSNSQSILRFIALNEVLLFPALIMMIFSGKGSMITPFIYYRFLTFRYCSQRNPYSRIVFQQLRIGAEQMIANPICPAFVRTIVQKAILTICRWAPPQVPTQPSSQAGAAR
ncbi:transmembrane protein 33-like [Symsagittifera roscoffensis]|uniref:transmembrane protein 33-like n=1 Tax=Symsagittifera roscoffensis TaxID=84072 RepID=UPI00307CC72B